MSVEEKYLMAQDRRQSGQPTTFPWGARGSQPQTFLWGVDDVLGEMATEQKQGSALLSKLGNPHVGWFVVGAVTGAALVAGIAAIYLSTRSLNRSRA